MQGIEPRGHIGRSVSGAGDVNGDGIDDVLIGSSNAQENAGESYVVIASKGGMPEHPLWFRNLEANPECEVQVASRKLRARAREAEGAERERLWQQMAKLYPPYDDYQKRAAGRRIPVVVLEPVEEARSR